MKMRDTERPRKTSASIAVPLDMHPKAEIQPASPAGMAMLHIEIPNSRSIVAVMPETPMQNSISPIRNVNILPAVFPKPSCRPESCRPFSILSSIPLIDCFRPYISNFWAEVLAAGMIIQSTGYRSSSIHNASQSLKRQAMPVTAKTRRNIMGSMLK